jgi:outer membrane protein assembly factor BamA
LLRFARTGRREWKKTISYLPYPKAHLGRVLFIGNAKFSDKKLRKAIAIDDGIALDWAQVRKDEEAIRKLYVDSGYADVAVSVRTGEESAENGAVELLFEINEEVGGNESFSAKKLRSIVRTKRRT